MLYKSRPYYFAFPYIIRKQPFLPISHTPTMASHDESWANETFIDVAPSQDGEDIETKNLGPMILDLLRTRQPRLSFVQPPQSTPTAEAQARRIRLEEYHAQLRSHSFANHYQYLEDMSAETDAVREAELLLEEALEEAQMKFKTLLRATAPYSAEQRDRAAEEADRQEDEKYTKLWAERDSIRKAKVDRRNQIESDHALAEKHATPR